MGGLTLSAAEYKTAQKAIKERTGVKIEDGEYRGCFNNMSAEYKQSIADSFDSVLDLDLLKDMLATNSDVGNRNWYKMVKDQKVVSALAAKGIVVTAVDKNGNAIDPAKVKKGQRDYIISRVDENGNVIKDANGNLEQIKMKDFNSDSYIQGAESMVNELLAAAGYDCVSQLDYASDAELQKAIDAARATATASDSNVGQTLSSLTSYTGSLTPDDHKDVSGGLSSNGSNSKVDNENLDKETETDEIDSEKDVETEPETELETNNDIKSKSETKFEQKSYNKEVEHLMNIYGYDIEEATQIVNKKYDLDFEYTGSVKMATV